MRKIPTLFKRDPNDMSRVTSEVHPDCKWVLDGLGVPTRKFDGTCVKFDGARWWGRREVKPGKTPPPDFQIEETDEATGKTVGWVPVDEHWPFYMALVEADLQAAAPWPEGTYELCGPKINGNPEHFDIHRLVPHGSHRLSGLILMRSYPQLEAWLSDPDIDIEGIVWHHGDGRMAKLKKRDFGAERP